jgi:SAM-dependent methyltransferase
VDLAPGMVEQTRRQAVDLGLSQVVTSLVTEEGLGVPDGSFDVVASSLVLFFAPDPAATLASWLRALVPGGRIGLATFGAADPVWERVDDLFRPYLPPQLLDARTTGTSGPFASDEGVEALLADAGAVAVRTVSRPLRVRFADADQWRRFSMGTGQRAFWRFVPEEERPRLHDRAAAILDEARADGGDIVLTQQVRYTLGSTPS